MIAQPKRGPRLARAYLYCLLGGFILAGVPVGALAGPANPGDTDAQDSPSLNPADGVVISGGAAVVSDYVAGGFTSTSGGPALQGDVRLSWHSFYMGMWASTLNYDSSKGVDGAKLDPNVEANFSVGYEKRIDRVEFEGTVFYVAYHGRDSNVYDLNYWEFKAGVSVHPTDMLKIGVNTYYSPNHYNQTGQNLVLEGVAKQYLPSFDMFKPSISGSIAYQEGDEKKHGIDYWFYNAGVSLEFRDHYKLDFRYYDTIDVPFSCDGICGSRFAASLKAEF
jgi:uncharacterized protein (TIGR02001 family)